MMVVIVGPTAVGKTELSIELAKRFDGEIVSADSMQIYKYLDIGTAKPTKDEMQGIPHYMIDIVYPEQDFNVAKYKKMATHYIDDISERNKLPILVGGTGLYISSILYDLKFTDAKPDTSLREKLEQDMKDKGVEALYDELNRVDPDSCKRIHINDKKRIIRALEVYYRTGKPMSHFEEDEKKLNSQYAPIIIIGLTMDREKLYQKINLRTDLMIQNGLLEEVESLIKKGYDKNLQSIQALGYKELYDYFEGTKTLEEVVEDIKRETRRYAKRQITWFKKDKNIKWFKVDEFKTKENLIDCVINYIKDEMEGG